MWVVIGWAIAGILIFANERVSKFDFGLVWLCLMVNLIEKYLM